MERTEKIALMVENCKFAEVLMSLKKLVLQEQTAGFMIKRNFKINSK
jgi:hypothetical protein